jgi:hypothetical protein
MKVQRLGPNQEVVAIFLGCKYQGRPLQKLAVNCLPTLLPIAENSTRQKLARGKDALAVGRKPPVRA